MAFRKSFRDLGSTLLGIDAFNVANDHEKSHDSRSFNEWGYEYLVGLISSVSNNQERKLFEVLGPKSLPRL